MNRTTLDFYEDDEDPREVLAAFEAAEKRLTRPPFEYVITPKVSGNVTSAWQWDGPAIVWE